MSDLLERLKQRPNFREDGEHAVGLWWRRAAFDRDLALDALEACCKELDDFGEISHPANQARAILKALRGTADGEGGK